MHLTGVSPPFKLQAHCAPDDAASSGARQGAEDKKETLKVIPAQQKMGPLGLRSSRMQSPQSDTHTALSKSEIVGSACLLSTYHMSID